MTWDGSRFLRASLDLMQFHCSTGTATGTNDRGAFRSPVLRARRERGGSAPPAPHDALGGTLGRDLHHRVEVYLAGGPSRCHRAMPTPRNLDAVLAHPTEMHLDGSLDATERRGDRFLVDAHAAAVLSLAARGELFVAGVPALVLVEVAANTLTKIAAGLAAGGRRYGTGVAVSVSAALVVAVIGLLR